MRDGYCRAISECVARVSRGNAVTIAAASDVRSIDNGLLRCRI